MSCKYFLMLLLFVIIKSYIFWIKGIATVSQIVLLQNIIAENWSFI